MQHETREDVRERFDRHYRLMTEALKSEWFNRSRNPFYYKVRYVDNPYAPGERWVMRSACCHYDCREGGQKCYVCPMLTEAERDAMRASIQAEAEAEAAM